MRNGTRVLLAVVLFGIVEARPSVTVHESAVVKTSLGTIRGLRHEFDGTAVYSYLGLPYAKPPLGSRRFAPPEMVDPWKGEMEAKSLAATCYLTVDEAFPQFPGAEMWNPPNKVTEDCLNMNIWVPEEHDGSVLVWVYGGGFFSGSPSLDLYDGTVLAAKKKMIVVNINYRLGPFGFLYLGADTSVPGNAGLLDQQMALKWIHDHIGSFGGDPSRVTLFGESAGAASVTAHLLAPDSYKYFNKIISMSGSIVSSWASRTPEAMLELSLRLAKRLNCSAVDPAVVHRCLQSLPDVIIQTEADEVGLEIGVPMSFPFVPVSADKNFFKGDLFEKLRRRDFKKDVSVILGTVRDEGTYWLPYYMSTHGFLFNHTISAEDPHNKALISKQQYRQSMEAFMPYFGNSPLIKNALMNAYEEVSESSSPEEQLRDGIGRFLGDYFFTCSTIEFADIVADHIYGNVYMYYFTTRSTANPWPRWMGVMHGYEIEYGFGQPFWRPHLYNQEKLKEEQKFSDFVMSIWTNFVVSGRPGDFWPRYNRIEKKALELGVSSISGQHNIFVDVHGSFCRLIEEGKALAGHASECRARRTEAVAAGQSSSAPVIAFLTVLTATLAF